MTTPRPFRSGDAVLVDGDTITNEQIRSLTAADGVEQDLGDFASVGELVMFACATPMDVKAHEIHMVARARCAEIWNARVVEAGGVL